MEIFEDFRQAFFSATSDSDKASLATLWRNKLLTNCDWTQGADSPLDADTKAAWATYRQALRDITEAEGFPDVVFPKDPVEVARDAYLANPETAGD